MGVHSLANLPSNSTIKKKAAIIIMAVEVKSISWKAQITFLCWDIFWPWNGMFILSSTISLQSLPTSYIDTNRLPYVGEYV